MAVVDMTFFNVFSYFHHYLATVIQKQTLLNAITMFERYNVL